MSETITTIRSTVAPSLPIAMPDYSQQYYDQYSNVLRLYFNQLDNTNIQTIDAINSIYVTNWLSLGTGIW
jgi:hypothetical protein